MKKKKIEVVSGNGENLQISPVYSHLPISKPKTDNTNNKKIVIPEEKKDKKRKTYGWWSS